MLIVDDLLLEKAKTALEAADASAECTVSAPLASPYGALRLAVFAGESGDRLAEEARKKRHLTLDGRGFRVIADLTTQLGRGETLLVEPA